MGLLGNWFKKQKKEQLKSVTKKADVDVTVPAKETKTQPAPAVSRASVASAKSYSIILRPLITEKGAIGESENRYSFVVADRATKEDIKKAIEELYGVKPLSVNVINVAGRRVRFGRHQGRRSDFKKAVVALPPGKSISLHKGV